MIDLDSVVFGQDGLIPAIVQDFSTNQVLMLAYMNRESLEITINERRTCFWSRSRGELWRKGKISGNIQEVVSITADCDADTLLVRVRQTGPACHTGAFSCFYEDILGSEKMAGEFTPQSLYDLITGRKTQGKDGSYTTYLFNSGEDKILKKLGEETAEVIIASKNNSKAEILYELSDLAYHAMVLMVEKGVNLHELWTELESRHVIDRK